MAPVRRALPQLHGQRLEASQHDAAVALRLAVELHGGEAPDERAERRLGLRPRQGRAEAVVDPVAERHVMTGIGPGDVERLGARTPAGGIVVGRPEAREHEGAGRDRRAVDVLVLERDATRELYGAVVP